MSRVLEMGMRKQRTSLIEQAKDGVENIGKEVLYVLV